MKYQSIIVMGVSGCGKSTLGLALANRLGWGFIEGDTHHPAANVAKMRAGTPLNDTDRAPWLAELSVLLSSAPQQVLSCSSLKAAYRQVLAGSKPEQCLFVYVQGTFEQISDRLKQAAQGDRAGHYMPNSLLQSQFDALEAQQAHAGGTGIQVVTIALTHSTAQQIEAVLRFCQSLEGASTNSKNSVRAEPVEAFLLSKATP